MSKLLHKGRIAAVIGAAGVSIMLAACSPSGNAVEQRFMSARWNNPSGGTYTCTDTAPRANLVAGTIDISETVDGQVAHQNVWGGECTMTGTDGSKLTDYIQVVYTANANGANAPFNAALATDWGTTDAHGAVAPIDPIGTNPKSAVYFKSGDAWSISGGVSSTSNPVIYDSSGNHHSSYNF